MKSRSLWIALAVAASLVVVEALVFRAVWLPVPHAGGDNAGYVALAHSLLSGQGYTELWDPARPPHTKYPPLFPLLLAVRMALGGVTWGALKAVTLLAGLATVLAAFLWARGRSGLAVGAGAALLTGLTASVVDYSRWLLSDVPFLALTLLALWAADRADGQPPDGGEAGAEADAAGGGGEPTPAHATAWWTVALALTGLAYFTRSAGLPLVVAVLGVLALRRRWRTLAAGGVALGGAALWWFLRARAVAVSQGAYGSEFWLVDPYRPELGRVGVGGLLGRVAANVVGYLTAHVPTGLVGNAQGPATALGILVALLGLVGWGLALRRRLRAAELFLPLYTGLILLWPEVWSGDRFALPLLPILLLYAATALRTGLRRLGPVAVTGGLAGFGGLVLLAQGAGIVRTAGDAAACRGAAATAGPYACYGAPMLEFTQAARWAGLNLPPGSAALTRKPRIWYVLSGQPSRTYPFVADTDSLLAAADDAGARWMVLDFVGAQGMRYLGRAVAARPGDFCITAGFGGDSRRPGTQLIGVLPPEARGESSTDPEAERVTIRGCAGELAGGEAPLSPYSVSSPIPILSSSSP